MVTLIYIKLYIKYVFFLLSVWTKIIKKKIFHCFLIKVGFEDMRKNWPYIMPYIIHIYAVFSHFFQFYFFFKCKNYFNYFSIIIIVFPVYRDRDYVREWKHIRIYFIYNSIYLYMNFFFSDDLYYIFIILILTTLLCISIQNKNFLYLFYYSFIKRFKLLIFLFSWQKILRRARFLKLIYDYFRADFDALLSMCFIPFLKMVKFT